MFGKLPAHGDFVSRNLDPETARAWDNWFSARIAAARSRLGEDFPRTHDAAPPWRFVEPPGAFGPAWRAGAFAPSMDSAGRRFFLLVATGPLQNAEAASGRAAAEALEPVLYEAMAETLPAAAVVDRAEMRLKTVGTLAEGSGAPSRRWESLGGPTLAAVVRDGPPEDVFGVEPMGG